MQPAGEKRDGHCCQSKLTASVRANRPLADDITRIVGLPMVTVIFVVAAGQAHVGAVVEALIAPTIGRQAAPCAARPCPHGSWR